MDDLDTTKDVFDREQARLDLVSAAENLIRVCNAEQAALEISKQAEDPSISDLVKELQALVKLLATPKALPKIPVALKEAWYAYVGTGERGRIHQSSSASVALLAFRQSLSNYNAVRAFHFQSRAFESQDKQGES